MMHLSLQILFFTTFSILVSSDQPDCGKRNQFRGYCFSFEYCTNYKCISETCSYFPRNSVLLKIQQTRIIPQCAVTNSTTLKSISGINSNIHVLASGSFANLPNLERILLPYNLIRELHHGIFHNVNVPLLDLSWNKIIYISEGAFNGITGLKYLNLSRNELSTVPVEYLPKNLVQINLSYNFLKRIALNGAKRPDLTSVDLSYNNLDSVAFSFDNTVEDLDLTHNRLKDIAFYDVNDCENLKIRSNLFSKTPEFFTYSRIKRVALHPNPWHCDELKSLWSQLQNNNIEEVKSNDAESQPLCSLNSEVEVITRLQNLNDLECDDDNYCSGSKLCRAHRCWDPCSNICHSSSICIVNNHEVECKCPDNTKKNPMDIISPCYDAACFSNDDCSSGKYCYNKTCKSLVAEGSTGGFGIPVAGAGAGASAGAGAGAGADIWNIASGGVYYPTSTVAIPQQEPPLYPQPTADQNMNGTGGFVSPPSNIPDPHRGNTENDPNKKPWWYNEIPKLRPTRNYNVLASLVG